MMNCRHRLLTIALAALAAGVVSPTAAQAARRSEKSGGLGGAALLNAFSGANPIVSAGAGEAVNPRTGSRYVFWRAPSGRIYEAWYTNSWHGPVSLGWFAASTPSVAVNAAGHQFVAWQGHGGHIFEAVEDRGWSRPRDLTASLRWGSAGQTAAPPSVTVAPGNDEPSLFWVARDGKIHEASYGGHWSSPVNRGWTAASAPSAATSSTGHQFVFWTAANSDLEEAWHYRAWSSPRDLTRALHWGKAGKATSAPGAAVNPGNGHQFVFWRAVGGRLNEAWSTGRWHGPSHFRWRAQSAPAAAVGASGNQYLAWIGPATRIYEAWHQSAWTPAVGRWTLSPGSGAYAEVVQTTASLSDRLTPHTDQQFSGSAGSLPVINVSDGARYQSIKGIGAAMTDTSAWLIYDRLSPGARAGLMNDLFTTAGIHLAYTLIPMGGSDFTADEKPYSYDDLPPGQSDPNLIRFSIAHDEAYILPVLRQMLAIAPQTWTFAVPWSPPPWMKANDSAGDLGHKGTLLAADYQPFANYFARFLEAYAQQGVPIDAIAPENEPRAASAFPAMYFPEPNETQWIAQNLVPALRAANLHPEIYGNDTSWQLANYGQEMATSSAASALTGIAWHCYGGAPTVMNDLHRATPHLDQIVTECASNLTHYPVPEILIGSLRNWATTVTLWNIATDPSGGPVEPPNSGCHGCRGLVTINQVTHRVKFNRDYYELGQVGDFLQSGAVRIGSNAFVTYNGNGSSYGASSGLDDVAFLNRDGSRVLVVYNNSSGQKRFAVRWHGRSFRYALAAGATVTFRWP
jgi:glucosylceramidase